MKSFEVKRGHGKTLEDGGLKSLMEEEFDEITEDGNNFTASFKVMTINVELISITEILVGTEMDSSASLEDLTDCHQAYNRFMEAATNFNAKQRVDRAKAKAKKEAKAAAEMEMAREESEEIKPEEEEDGYRARPPEEENGQVEET
tara:strand:+ start:245 stop:682 length:438 start_codon:yes stop_codon:yes gene_type:complete